MKTLRRGILLLLFSLLFSAERASAALPVLICAWSTSECNTVVVQSIFGWSMSISCFDGTGGRWLGTDMWNGHCVGGWTMM